MEKKSYKSWTISDAFWEAVKDEIPQRQRVECKIYKRKPGGGRKPLSKRRVLEGIFYVLRTGCQWKAVPKEYGAASSIHQYFQEWASAGFFERIWSKGLEKYDELEWDRLGMAKSGRLHGESPADPGSRWKEPNGSRKKWGQNAVY